ncbi:hypothetical protein PPO43_14845 [Saprospira sp. CCB-QB6]|uniref:hypothetical protein n=1 Tax=Saprospira sp. CCB-QB6 TaxID=3023936 RepID=UPI0023492C13|nr:hypothetical protein [Saprospira sp. CCB-QB6]WCL81251.1 hypothetical protein PPO43_14845 [Saprospira sp. CCB-QB6]
MDNKLFSQAFFLLGIFFDFLWGCPSPKGSGRAVRGLAILLGPALFRFAQKLGLACGHPLPSLSRSTVFFLLAIFFGLFF